MRAAKSASRPKSARNQRRLIHFLHGLEVGFESGAVLLLGFQLRLKFFHEQFEAADFVAQFLRVS